MNVKVWNLEYAPFPREGLNHLLPSPNCQIAMTLKLEAAKFARLSQFDVPETTAALRRFQKKLRAKIWEKLGVPYDGSLPLDVREYGSLKQDGFTIKKLIYQSRPGLYVTALLYVPDGDGPFPAVMHMHGHFNTGKLGDRIQFLSMALVRAGYVVLANDCFGVYERAVKYANTEYHGGYLGGALLNIGESLMGEQLVDNMRGVDLLASLPYVDANRIGATGASGGGNQTMWLSGMDERIKAAMPVVSVGSFESYVTGVNCICELLPDGMTFTEEAGVLALTAPRALRIGTAFYDVNPTFGVEEMLKTYHQVEKLYWKLNAPERIAYTIADRVHGMQDRMRDAVLGWFACYLKGEGAGYPIQAPPQEMLPNEQLTVFSNAEERPAIVRTIDVHCRLIGDELRKAYLGQKSFNAAQKRTDLKKALRLRPLPAQLSLTKYATIDGLERYAVEAGDHLIPVLLKRGSKQGKFKMLLHPEGKADITEEALAKAAKDGSSVVMFDLFGQGETALPNNILGEYHQFFRQLLWLGRSLPGEWVFDILAVARILKRRFSAMDITVRAERETGVCAVFAAAVSDTAFAVEAVDAPASYLFRRDSIPVFKYDAFKKHQEGYLYSVMLPIPGLLKWGDVSLAAALAPVKIKFESPRAYDGTPYTPEEIKALDKEIQSARKKLG